MLFRSDSLKGIIKKIVGLLEDLLMGWQIYGWSNEMFERDELS
jgi:hypothetical protein